MIRTPPRHPPGGAGQAHQDCVAAAANAARQLESLGHHVEPTEAAELDAPALLEVLPTVFSAILAWELEHWSKRLGRRLEPGELEPMNAVVAETGRSVTATQWLAGIHAWQHWARGVAALWEQEFDVLLTPTLPLPLGQLAPTAKDPAELLAGMIETIAFTLPFNVTGQPAISRPLHRNADGMPIGVQLVAAYGREDVLIRLAAQLEHAASWCGVRPPVSP